MMSRMEQTLHSDALQVAAKALCGTGRQLVKAGLSPGTSGNISVLVEDLVLISASGTRLDALSVEHIAIVDRRGEHVGGARPSKEVPLHLAMYGRDTAFTAVVHVHSPWAVAASCLSPYSNTSALAPLTPYLVMRVGQVPLAPYAPPGSSRLGEDIGSMPMRFQAALMAHHGLVCAGASLEEGIDRATEVEEAARLMVLLNGKDTTVLSDAAVQELVAQWDSVWD